MLLENDPVKNYDIYLHSIVPPGVYSIYQCVFPLNELIAGGRTCSVTLRTARSWCTDSLFTAEQAIEMFFCSVGEGRSRASAVTWLNS